MAVLTRSMPYRLDQGAVGSISDLSNLPSLIANADYMFQVLFEDLKKVGASAGSVPGAALTETDDTNVTLTLSGSPATALLAATNLTLGWVGQLGVTRGGTGLATVSQGDIFYGSASNVISKLAKNTTATRYLSNTGTTNNPAWAQVDLSNGVTGTLPVANGGTGQTTLTAHGVLLGNGTSGVAATAVGATNTVLHGNTGADPSYSAVVEADITLANNTTNDVSTTKHGFAPKSPNDASKFLDGTGAYSIPGSSGVSSDWDSTAFATGDQSVTNSATLANETELVLALASGKVYRVGYYILYSANDINADYRWQFSCPVASISSGSGYTIGINNIDTILATGSAFQPCAVGAWPQSVDNMGTDGVDGIRSFFGEFLITTNAAANLQFQFANGTAGVGRVSKTRTGSFIRIKKLN